MKSPGSHRPPQPRHRPKYRASMKGPTPSPSASAACSASRAKSGCTAVTTARSRLQWPHIDRGSWPKSQNGSGLDTVKPPPLGAQPLDHHGLRLALGPPDPGRGGDHRAVGDHQAADAAEVIV